MTVRERLAITSALSGTPLSRQHELALAGKLVKPPKALPWTAFDRSAHAEAALGLATHLHRGLARGEYAAIGLFAELAAGLSFTGAPLDFIHAATVVSGDEARHAEYCVRMATLCHGAEVPIEVAANDLHASLAPLVNIEEVDFAMLQLVAFSETLATGLLAECQRRAKDRLSRALFRALISDEVHHARLGWYYAAYRSPQWSLAERQRLADRVSGFVVEVERQFWVGRDAPPAAAASARALGILDSKAQRAVIRDVMENEIVPALDALGFSGSRVWSVRRRGAPAPRRRKR